MTLVLLYFMAFGGAGKMAQVVYASSAFWCLTLVSLAIGVGVKLKEPKRFTWPEYLLYSEFCICSVFGLYSLMFSTSTDLVRVETWNGKATQATYQEPHTDKRTVTDYDSKGRVSGSHTEYYPHSAEYNVETTAGGYSANASIYTAFKQRWGNETSSSGYCGSASEPFSVYHVTFDGQEPHRVPVSLDKRYVNFVTASGSIKKLQGLMVGYENYLQQHPRAHSGDYGTTELDRVVVAGAPVRASWITAVDLMLDRELSELGPFKQCNVLVYVVGSGDQKFAKALEEHWRLGEKNDIVVVIGAPQFPVVEWAYVIAWTDSEEFKVELRNQILEMGKGKEGEQQGIGNAGTFVDALCAQIRKPAPAGGYERKPMSDYDYLIAEVSLPWWASLLIVLLGGGLQFGAAMVLIHNDIEA